MSASCSAVARDRSEESRRSARACALSRYAADDIGQRLCRVQGVGVQRPGGVAVEVERAELFVTMTQREREDRVQPDVERAGDELREPRLGLEVRHRDGCARAVRLQAGPVAELGLQLLEPQRRLVRRRHVVGIAAGRDERDPRGRDRQDVDDALDHLIEDGLDREVRHQRAGEFTQHRRKLLITWHRTPPTNRISGRGDWTELTSSRVLKALYGAIGRQRRPWWPGWLAPRAGAAKPQVRACRNANVGGRSHWGDGTLAVGQPLAVVRCARRARGRDLLVDRRRVPAVHRRRGDHGGDPGTRRVRGGLATDPGHPPPCTGRGHRSPAGSGWSSLAVGWELLAYFSIPRDDHPTLSVIADEIMSVHVGRALMFLLWLVLGWLLVRNPRVSRS